MLRFEVERAASQISRVNYEFVIAIVLTIHQTSSEAKNCMLCWHMVALISGPANVGIV
jgi:hypothetical protein